MDDMSTVAGSMTQTFLVSPQLQLAMATDPRSDLSETEVYRVVSSQISKG